MLSCHNEKHLQKVPHLDAKCIIFNLEDGVSKEQKPEALKLCAKYLKIYNDMNINKMLVVRINALDDGGINEIKYLNEFKPDAIRIPKINSKEDVVKVLELIDDDIDIHLSIETSSAWKNLSSLKTDSRVTTFYLGVLDLFADMKLAHSIIDINNPTMKYILSHFLISSLSIGVKPVSFVYQNYKNLNLFESWLDLEKQMGYDAKVCISPSQVRLVNEVFSDDAKEIARAKKIIELFENQRELGITGFVDEQYGFIDEPIYKGALALLHR